MGVRGKMGVRSFVGSTRCAKGGKGRKEGGSFPHLILSRQASLILLEPLTSTLSLVSYDQQRKKGEDKKRLWPLACVLPTEFLFSRPGLLTRGKKGSSKQFLLQEGNREITRGR